MSFDARGAAADIELELRALGTPQRAGGEKAYLKSDLDFLGTTVPDIRRVAKRFVKEHSGLTHDDLVSVVEELWAAPIHERRMTAVVLLEDHLPLLGYADLALVERLIRSSKTWALVDALAAGVTGKIVLDHPPATSVLDRWGTDEDFWVRRSALLGGMAALKRGADFGRFARVAEPMIEDKEFFIRKALGWVLRETSKKRPAEVAAWMAPRTHRLSGVTMREAVKYLEPQQRFRLVEAYKARKPTD